MENKTYNDINFQPLSEMRGAGTAALRQTFHIAPAIVITLAVVLCLLVGGYVHPQFGIILFFLFLGYYAGVVSKAKAKIWNRFALVNNWPIFNTKGNDPRYVPPGLSGIGHGQMLSTIIQASFEGHDCDIYVYQFTTGSGKNSQTHFYTIARLHMTKQFPHIILDSKQCYALRKRGDATEAVSLEGDFSNYFNLYYKKGEHIDALSIITPDIMQSVLNTSKYHDIEIIDSSVFFMIHSDRRTVNDIQQIFYSVDKIADELKHKEKTLRYKAAYSEQARILAQLTNQSFGSLNTTTNQLSILLLIIAIAPFIFFVLMGLMFSIISN